MDYCYNDGGRAAAGYRGDTYDCVTRAIAIAAGLPYADVYTQLTQRIRTHRPSQKQGLRTARTGVVRPIYHEYLIQTLGPRGRRRCRLALVAPITSEPTRYP